MKHGHCLCENVSWKYDGDETWACYCHCASCRRNCAAPVVAFIGVKLTDFQWTGAPPKFYASSANVKRFFCNTCGTPVAFQATHYPGEIHLYAAGLSKPEGFEPTFHVHYSEKLPWLHIQDDLPKHQGSLEV